MKERKGIKMTLEKWELDPQKIYEEIKQTIEKDLPLVLKGMSYVDDLLEHAENDGDFDIIWELRSALSAFEKAEEALTEAMDGLWKKEEKFTRRG
ncbi:MAG: hypothetical protein R3251_03375 [Candidatus Spechtbacterales bacterium]|nr:hypothetical protein [Candidatus Spechtbacterales bacterium]